MGNMEILIFKGRLMLADMCPENLHICDVEVRWSYEDHQVRFYKVGYPTLHGVEPVKPKEYAKVKDVAPLMRTLDDGSVIINDPGHNGYYTWIELSK